MSSDVVIDSAVFIEVYLADELSPEGTSFIRHLKDTEARIHVPTLFKYEVTSVLWNSMLRGRISHESGFASLANFFEVVVNDVFDMELLKRGFDLAREHNLSTAYDSQYLAVAERVGCEVWTTDKKFFNALFGKSPVVNWLGHWKIQAPTLA